MSPITKKTKGVQKERFNSYLDPDCIIFFLQIYNRRGHGLFKRQQYFESRASFQKCRDFIGKSDMKTAERERWRIKLAKQMSVFNSAKKGVVNNPLPPRPWSQVIENGCNHIEIDDEAKNIKAQTDIKVEQLIFSEKALAAVLLKTHAEGRICPHNLTRMPAGIPCSLGSPARWATEATREEVNNSYHQFEAKTQEAWKEAGLGPVTHLAFRIFCLIPKMDLKEFFVAPNSNPKTELEEIFQLPIGQVPSQDTLVMSCLVNFMLNILELNGYFDEDKKKVTKNDVAKLLIKSILISAKYGQNIFLVRPPNNAADLWNLKQIPTLDFAFGMFPKFAQMKSVCNSGKTTAEKKTILNVLTQQCGSDVTIFFQDDKLFIQSLRKMAAGQPIDIFGGGEAAEISENNSEMLKQNQDMINFKCSGKKCTLSFPLTEKTNEKVVKCPLEGCGAETNIWRRLKRIVELKKDHQTARKEVENDKLRSGIAFFEDLITEWETFVYRPCKEISILEDDMKKAILMNNEIMERQWIETCT
jgi:hypothetical protein